jgi:hypothetical protein
VVDLEEPRTLRPTIGWPASGAKHHPAYQLLRIPLLGDSVNKPARIRLGHEGGLWGSQLCLVAEVLLALVGLLISSSENASSSTRFVNKGKREG